MRVILYNTTSDNRVLNKSITLIKEIDAELKDADDVIYPTLKIQRFKDWEKVNYIYIKSFNRYYYVNTIKQLLGNTILLDCSVDVLMSNKDAIRNLTCIIDKQENSATTYSDKYLDDGSFITECRTFNSILNFPQGFNENGEFILITAGRIGN